MDLNPKRLIKILEQNGFKYKRAKGSHKVYYNSISNKTVVVPYHKGRDLKKGTFITILKQADIKSSNI